MSAEARTEAERDSSLASAIPAFVVTSLLG